MHRPMLRILVAFVCLCLPVCAAFAAPVELDPPDITPGLEATTIVNLDVTAGPSGAPNGFTLEWMTQAQFDALGGWPEDPLDPNIQSAVFLGFPTLNTVDGTITFLLAPGEVASVQVGDIFDETGIQSDDANEMSPGTAYVFRVKANGDPGISGGNGSLLPSSPYSNNQYCHTKPHDHNDCTHSQGYWKNHPSEWPISSLKLGNIIYTKAQAVLILNQPAGGNGLISLAHQLIAAKLNIALGAVVPASITAAISTSDALIGNKIIPPIGAGHLAPATTSHLTDDLEEFNDDEMHHSCKVVTGTNQRTWGAVKAMYR